jgi:thymidylate synthase (FAD)
VIKVLDKGYVLLVDKMGTDLTPVNAARASFARKSDQMTEKDERLLSYLVEHNHTSPFRHAVLQFEVKAPLMVCNQWFRYVTGAASSDPFFAWNEQSRRYVTSEPEFYTPAEWRSAPENKKQGSGLAASEWASEKAYESLSAVVDEALLHYSMCIERGICAEQARLFLPAYAMYTTWYWTASLQAVCHFLRERLDGHAQYEIRQYAQAVRDIAMEHFPLSVGRLVDA